MAIKTLRQIVLDTETTGLDPKLGHRIIEIGCVELINRRLTNKHFHMYVNPQREIDAGAIKVHGITNDFLQDKPLFAEIVVEFMNFIQDAELIIHNAPFDVGFLNHEYALASTELGTIADHNSVLDTLEYARKKHPGQRNSLDALCKRYGIDNSKRELHGALLDSEILAEVYLLMTGGQSSLLNAAHTEHHTQVKVIQHSLQQRAKLKIIPATAEELLAHTQRLHAISNTTWK